MHDGGFALQVGRVGIAKSLEGSERLLESKNFVMDDGGFALQG